MQKLVTFRLFSEHGADNDVEEHLESYLTNGWEVVSVTPAVAGVGPAASHGFRGERAGFVFGWVTVLLFKRERKQSKAGKTLPVKSVSAKTGKSG